MIEHYTPKYFKAHEFVPPSVYSDRGEKSFQLIDARILITADTLREHWGPMTINNWYWDGDRLWSGLRTPESPYYSPYSQHTFGRALDGIFRKVNAEIVREDILKNPDKYPFITFLETDISWVHADCRNIERITTWSPSR